ncbi:MAG: glycosyltransferase family 2 protein [Pseudomonadota bacterium]
MESLENSRIPLVIPVYNHGDRVGLVIEKALKTGRPIIVVDDGSTDRTPEALSSFPGITVLRHPRNLGKGAALATGLAAAARVADLAITLDADGQHDPEEAENLIRALGDGRRRALVLGRRRDMAQAGAPWTSRWGGKWSNFWVWLAGGGLHPDTQTGFRLYPLPETLRLGAGCERFQYELEILVLAAWHRLPILSAPVTVTYQPRGERVSHFQPGPDFWRNTKTIARLIAARLLIPRYFRTRKAEP